MFRATFNLTLLTVALALTAGRAAHAAAPVSEPVADPNQVIAIDVLLEPSPELARFAESANASLRKDVPTGYTLGAEQIPHISLVHRYVRAGDLPRIEAELATLLAADNPLVFPLTAYCYEHAKWEGYALMVIAIERSSQLSRVQGKVADAVQPFAVPTGTAAAFSTSREIPKIEPGIVDYVQNFIPKSSGKNYKPHITIGLAHEDIAKDLEAIRFPHRTFRPAAVAIYQLGGYGTAQKKLWSWKPGPPRP